MKGWGIGAQGVSYRAKCTFEDAGHKLNVPLCYLLLPRDQHLLCERDVIYIYSYICKQDLEQTGGS